MGKVKDYNKYENYFKYGLEQNNERRVLFTRKVFKLITRKTKITDSQWKKGISSGNIKQVKGKWYKLYYIPVNLRDFINYWKGKPFGYSNDLQLPISKVSKIVGVYKGRVSKKYFRGGYNPDYLTKELLANADPSFKEFISNNIVEVMPGTWKYNHVNLVTMATPHTTKYTYKDMLKGLKSRRHIELVLPELPAFDPSTIENVRVNHTSFNGLKTSAAFGGKRWASTPYTKGVAAQYAEYIMNHKGEYILDTSLYHVGGREKRVTTALDRPYKEIKTRVTMCQEDVPTIIGQAVVVGINESLQKLAEGFNWGGRINGRGRYLDFVEALDIKGDNELTNFGIDFEQHDNNVSREQIIFGMAVLRCCYPECDKLDRLFFYITSSLTNKRVVMPESNLIYELSKGIPSGHSFTSILTTVCAYITISTAITKVIPHNKIKETHLQGAGDDWNGKIHKRYLSEVTQEIRNNSGSKCDPLEECQGSIQMNSDEVKPTFLKKNYKGGLIAWYRKELYTNFSFPTSKQKLSTLLENIRVMCVSGPFDIMLNITMYNLAVLSTAKEVFSQYFDFINKDPTFKGKTVNDYILFLADKHGGPSLNNMINIEHEDFKAHKVYSDRGVYLGLIDISDILFDYTAKFKSSINISQRWMLRKASFERWESVVRLAVFDTKKKYFKSHNINMYDTTLYNEIYC